MSLGLMYSLFGNVNSLCYSRMLISKVNLINLYVTSMFTLFLYMFVQTSLFDLFVVLFQSYFAFSNRLNNNIEVLFAPSSFLWNEILSRHKLC